MIDPKSINTCLHAVPRMNSPTTKFPPTHNFLNGVSSPVGKDFVPIKYSSALKIIYALGLATDLGASLQYQTFVKSGKKKKRLYMIS